MKKLLLSLAMFGAVVLGQDPRELDSMSMPTQLQQQQLQQMLGQQLYGQQFGQQFGHTQQQRQLFGQQQEQVEPVLPAQFGEVKDPLSMSSWGAAGEQPSAVGGAGYYQSVGIGGRGQFLSATPIGAQLQYSTSPILEQLRVMSTSSYNPSAIRSHESVPSAAMLSGVWDDAALIEGQQQAYRTSMFMGQKPVPQSYIQPMLDASLMSQQVPPAAAIATASAPFPAAKSVKPIKEFKYVNAPITSQYETLPVKELPNIVQLYAVPSTFTTQENIKQPITQPVWQPYLQRFEQRAVPVVQPVINRVVQPIIHRQLHPYLSSETIQGPQHEAIVKPPKVLEFKNEAVVGSEMNALPMEDRSQKPNVPAVAPATAHKKQSR